MNTQNTKDDIARLLHLFKELVAQVHWSNLYGVLNHAELGARKTAGQLSDAANPLSCLVKIFNDYEGFLSTESYVAICCCRSKSAPSQEDSICSKQ